MPTVIDLISSSPPRPRSTKSTLPARNTKSSTSKIYDFDLDDFGSAGDLEFTIEQPSKKQRLSPSPVFDFTSSPALVTRDPLLDPASHSCTLPRLVKDHDVECDIDNVVNTNNSDIFQFTSSAPERVQQDTLQEKFVFELSSDHEAPVEDAIQSSSRPVMISKPVLSNRTANLLAGLNAASANSTHRRTKKSPIARSVSVEAGNTKTNRFRKITKVSAARTDDIIDSSQPNPSKQVEKAMNLPEQDVEMTTALKRSSNISKADRDASKEAERERKRMEKETKAQEKQKAADIAEVNKSKTNKKNSTPEMMLDMPASLRGLSVGKQVEEFMKQLDVQITYSSDEEVNLTNDTAVTSGNIIRWRRKVTADYDEDLEMWKPLKQPRVSREAHVIVYLKAEEFVSLAVIGQSDSVKSASEVSESVMKSNVDAHVKTMRIRYPSSTLIYLIESLSSWTRRSQSAKNRAYTAAVRSQTLNDEHDNNDDDENNPIPSTNQSRARSSKSKRKPPKPQLDLSTITTDTTETLLLHLQLHHQPCLIHHTTSPATTAAQISTFTQHLSTRPYRLAEQSHNLASASFCMTTGQIRTGATPHEAYINMLQEINRVTPSMAYGISAAGYKTVGQLVKGFRDDGNLMLEDVRKSVNRDGAWSDKRLGPMVSRRLYRVWMGKDPGARDGIA